MSSKRNRHSRFLFINLFENSIKKNPYNTLNVFCAEIYLVIKKTLKKARKI